MSGKGPRFIWYVAWRYLLARPRRVSATWFYVVWVAATVFAGFAASLPLRAYGVPYMTPGPLFPPWLLICLAVSVPLLLCFWTGAIAYRFFFRKLAAGFSGISLCIVVLGLYFMGLAHAPNGEPERYLFAPWFGVLHGLEAFRSGDFSWMLFIPGAALLAGLAVWLGAYARRLRFSLVLLGISFALGLLMIAGYSHMVGVALRESQMLLGEKLDPPMWLVMPLIGTGLLLVLSSTLLIVRSVFTFFTTVSIGGVCIGGMALVIVLSVMGGFENYLRSRILGSEAHLLITRQDDEPFTDYREVEASIKKVPGIIATGPFVQSEVVLAANGSYDSAIIKGVDPDRLGLVTDLQKHLEEPDAIEKMWPLDPTGKAMRPASGPAPAPAPEKTAPEKDVADPAPDDMDLPEDDLPSDLSAEPDPAPPDMEIPDADVPRDLSGTRVHMAGAATDADKLEENQPERLDDPLVLALPGLLVGKELGKHVSIYDGQEVRLVSPFAQQTPIGEVPRTKRARVAGTFKTGMYKQDLKYSYIELGALQEFLDLGDQVNGIEIRIVNPDQTAPVMEELQKILGPTFRVQDWKQINGSLFSALKLEKIAMFLVLVITILVASFSIMGTLIMTVYEKGREISILKTLGASAEDVIRIFVVQGFCIGFVGTVVGVGLGLTACWLNIVIGVPIPPEVYYMDRLPTHVEPAPIALIAAAGLLISVLATVYPAYVASRLDVVAGLRKE